ncbi:flagellar basal body L-ring protein FlgH [bacterium]|nr:flagellar basal body L-ring protein FlgH [bacterium]
MLILTIALITGITGASAESLFTLGASQTYAAAPKSLYGGVQARGVGDLISIIMSETSSITNNLTYSSSKTSSTVDNFSKFLNSLFGHKVINDNINGFGGSNTVANTGVGTRNFQYNDRVAVQIIQQMPNGNLVVQGKKIVINGGERTELLVTGVVDPRWINALGQVYSYNVSNLQFSVSGRGSVSRSDGDGIFNRFIKYLF